MSDAPVNGALSARHNAEAAERLYTPVRNASTYRSKHDRRKPVLGTAGGVCPEARDDLPLPTPRLWLFDYPRGKG